MTAFATVQAALLAALTAAPVLAGGNIGVNTTRPVAAGKTTAIVLRLERSAGLETALGALDWDTEFAVECHARGATGADPVAAVDALLADVWARIAALTDAQLGGSPQGQAAIDWQFDADETPTVVAVLRVTVRHRTPFTTLTAWS